MKREKIKSDPFVFIDEIGCVSDCKVSSKLIMLNNDEVKRCK
jgi:hypothetical protein